MIVPDLAVWAWLLLGLSAFVVGVSKTAIPGVNTLSVAVFAAVLPARESTGTLLVLLIVADLFAIVSYRRDANWRALVRLPPCWSVSCWVPSSSRWRTTSGSAG